MKNLNSYFYNAIHSSILAEAEDIKSIVSYYGHPRKCRLCDFFKTQIKDNKLYDSVDKQDIDTFICEINFNSKYKFENMRQKAFGEYLQNLSDSINENDLKGLIELSDSDVKIFTKSLVFYKGVEADMLGVDDIEDDRRDTGGDILFSEIYYLMKHYTRQPSIKKAALIAGAKYFYIYKWNRGLYYTSIFYFWKSIA